MPDHQDIPSAAVGPAQVSEVPQFRTAEYAHIPGTERCRICNNLVSGQYFRVNNQLACARCAGEALAGQPKDSHAAFLRGLLLGVGGAAAGLILYSAVAIVTGWTIGYVALAVGWLVGKGMMKGSNGMGGLRYQIAALALTYLAISMSAIPIGISYALKQHPSRTHQHATADDGNTRDVTPQNDDGSTTSEPATRNNWRPLMGQLLLWGIASPFLELQNPIQGLIGLFIVFIGLSIAFRLTASKPLAVDGPYSVTG
jgi:hypothetical protein